MGIVVRQETSGGSNPPQDAKLFTRLRRLWEQNRPRLVWGQDLGIPSCPYLQRWILCLGLFSLRLHRWRASDDERAFHDHPWWFLTLVLRGGYVDVSPSGEDRLRPGSWRFRPALHRHTVRVDPGGAWTLMLTGPDLRRWGFYARNRFYSVQQYFRKFKHHPCDQGVPLEGGGPLTAELPAGAL